MSRTIGPTLGWLNRTLGTTFGLAAGETGTGPLVRQTSPTLITPALGTPTALVLTSATGLPVAGGGTGATTGQAAGITLSHLYTAKAAVGTASSTLNTETICGWVNVAGNSLGALGSVELDMLWQVAIGGGTMAWEFDMRIVAGTSNGTLAGTSLIAGTMTANQRGRMSIKIWNNNATNSQIVAPVPTTSYTFTGNAFTTAAIDTTSAFTISLNCKVTNNATDVATLTRYEAKLVGSAGN